MKTFDDFLRDAEDLYSTSDLNFLIKIAIKHYSDYIYQQGFDEGYMKGQRYA